MRTLGLLFALLVATATGFGVAIVTVGDWYDCGCLGCDHVGA